jgi:hypothetical protein
MDGVPFVLLEGRQAMSRDKKGEEGKKVYLLHMPHVPDPGCVGGERFTCFTCMAEQLTEGSTVFFGLVHL